MKQKIAPQDLAIIYQGKNGEIQLRGDIQHETIWATRGQMSEMFGINPQAITKHIQNIYKDNELTRSATSSKMELVQNESGRTVKRQVDIYNLDIIIATGYRVNSIVGTKFRQWATKTLREYITKGFVLNKKVIEKNHAEFLKAISLIQELLPEHTPLDTGVVLELVKEFSTTWKSLDAYDQESLQKAGHTKTTINLSADELVESIAQLRADLIRQKLATEIFAQERTTDSTRGIFGNVMQSFGGKSVYATAEDQAAHLLYFIIKNHPYVDGNKRTAAWSFIWFLRKAKISGYKNINPSALTAITLLIAESNPDKKDQMIALVTNMLATKKSK